MSGFVLTAVPEFTKTAGASSRTARLLVALWLLGRAGFWLSGVLCWMEAFGLLCVLIAPVLWRARADGLWGVRGRGLFWFQHLP